MMASMLTACSEKESTNTTISGRLVGSNVDTVYLERVSDTFGTPTTIASKALKDNGSFSFDLDIKEGSSPRFYRLTFGDKSRPVTLVVSPGDDIKIESAGNVFLNYQVEGSEESALIAEFCHDYFRAADELANIAENKLYKSGNNQYLQREAYNNALEAMKFQVRFVGSHQNKLAAFFAMRHRTAEQYIPQLDGQGINIAHYTSVLEGIKKSYPNSPYIAIIEGYIAESEAYNKLAQNIEVISYPDIELLDTASKKHKLSDLNGKVTLLYFWTALNPMCNNLNADLKELYNTYHDEGFEIYHVSIDEDSLLWMTASTEQKLPWASLYGGSNSRAADLYNVVLVPTTYIIDREGNISEVEPKIEDIRAKVKRAI